MENVVAYRRVSTIEQKLHGLSLDAQRDTLERYAKAHNLNIIAWYDDEGISGRKLIRRRPALQQMLKDSANGNFTRIIFIKLDRYFRSVGEYYESQKILDKNHVTWTATEERYDQTTASGRFWITQKLAMAEYEADNTGERIKLVNEYKVRCGQALQGSEAQPLGYKVEKDSEGIRRVVIDKEKEAMLRDIIDSYMKYQSKHKVLLMLLDKYEYKLTYRSLANFLSNTKICGQYRGNEKYCEALIDKETFDKIQDIIKRNIKHRRYDDNVYLFSGLIECPVCKKTLCGAYTDSRRMLETGEYRYYKRIYFYRCNGIRARICSSKSINEEKLEEQMLANFDKYVDAYISDANVIEENKKQIDNENKIKSKKEEMERLTNVYLKGRITEKEYDDQYQKIEAEIKAISNISAPKHIRRKKEYQDLLSSDWKNIYKALDRDNKRAFWRHFVKTIYIKDKTLIGIDFF